MHHLRGGQGAVVDHNSGPAQQLQNVEAGEEQAALLAEAHLHGLHGAFAHPAADKAGQEQQRAADEVTDEDGEYTFAEAQRSEVGAGQYLGDGHAGAEPDEAVFKQGGATLFHYRASFAYSPCRSKLWAMGPEPWPRSSWAARQPET